MRLLGELRPPADCQQARRWGMVSPCWRPFSRRASWVGRGSARLPFCRRPSAIGYRTAPFRRPGGPSFVGYVEGVLGALLYIFGILAYMGLLIGDVNTRPRGKRGTDCTKVNVRTRRVVCVDFLAAGQPEAWLYMYLALTGSVRVVAFYITCEPVAEPVVLLAIRARPGDRARTRRTDARSRALRSASRRPCGRRERAAIWSSCLVPGEKDDWGEHTTVKVGDRFYRILDSAVRDEGRSRLLAYRLEELADRRRRFATWSTRLLGHRPTFPTRSPGRSPAGSSTSRTGHLMAEDEMWGVCRLRPRRQCREVPTASTLISQTPR